MNELRIDEAEVHKIAKFCLTFISSDELVEGKGALYIWFPYVYGVGYHELLELNQQVTTEYVKK